MSSAAERVFRTLLRLLPAAYTPRDAESMFDIFQRRAVRARRLGAVRYGGFLFKECIGLLLMVLRERVRRVFSFGGVPEVIADLPYAIRRLRATPVFTFAAVGTLAIAIGANTAVFAVLHRVVLSPLPYPAPDRLVAIDHDAPGIGRASIGLSLGLYWEYAALPSVEAIALYYTGQQTVSGVGEAERLPFLHTTPSLGGILGVRPLLGRWFTDAEGVTGAAPVVFLSHDYWQHRFGGKPDVVGTTVRLNGVAHEVVGVAAPGFAFPDRRVRFIVPLRLTPAVRRVSGFNYQGVARLAPATTIEEGRRRQDELIADVPHRFAADAEVTDGTFAQTRLRSTMVPLADRVVGETARMMWLLFGAVAVVLLVAVANLGNLTLVRAEARQVEMAVRRALGAGRRAIVGTVVSEACILAGLGGAVGTAFAVAAVNRFVADPLLVWPRAHEIAVGPAAMLFAIGLSTAVAASLGLVPLIRPADRPEALLHGGGRTHSAGRRAAVSRQILIAMQIGLAVVLLAAAMLLTRSADRLQRVNPGFDADARLVFEVGLPRSVYRTANQAAQFNDRLLNALEQLPGVSGAALTSNLPLEGRGQVNAVEVEGRGASAGDQRAASLWQVSIGYFKTMAIPVLRGRDFEPREATENAEVAVVDRAFADALFPDEDPLGQKIRQTGQTPWLTIVGVVGSTATESLREREGARVIYMPGTGIHQPSLILKTHGDPLARLSDVQRLVAAQDPSVAISRPEPLVAVVDRSIAETRMVTAAVVAAAAAALLLGLIGVYGVVAYVVAQRTSEIGIRLALGATRLDVTRLVVRQTAVALLLGIGMGIVVSFAAARWLQSWLFDVSPTDPVNFVGASLVMLTTAGWACWRAARRAAVVDPLQAMRGSTSP